MKRAFLLLLLLCLVSSVSALIVEERTVNDILVPEFPNQAARFILSITGAEGGSYNLYTLEDVRLMPKSNFHLTDEKNEIEIYVYPTDELKERGFFSFRYNIKKSSGESFENRIVVNVLDFEDIVEVSSDSNEPKDNKITFYVENKEDIELKGIKARFFSVFFDVEKTFDLGSNEKREFVVGVDKEKMSKIAAGSYLIKGEFETDKGKRVIEGKIYLGVKKGIDTDEDSSGFLIHTETIRKTNVGNVDETVSIKVKKDIVSRLFTSFNIEPDLVERDGFVITYTWNRKLGQTEFFTVKVKTNYIFPLLIVLVAALLVWGFKRYTETKIEIRKSVSPLRTKGGQFALRIKINVKSRKSVENVSLIDKVPAIVKIYEKFGTIKPDKIDTKNRRVQWDIGDLNAGEERVFSYVIYSKVGVVGKFSLPEALGVFEKDGEIHEVESNKVFFLSEQIKREED